MEKLDQKDKAVGEKAEVLLKEVLRGLGLEAEISIAQEDDTLFVCLEGEGLGLLIGREGRTLSAIQLLLNAATNRTDSKLRRIILDAQGYRRRKQEMLEETAKRAAQKAEKTKAPVALEPMGPFERRVVHLALQDNPRVKTASEGEEPKRRVVIIPAEEEESSQSDF